MHRTTQGDGDASLGTGTISGKWRAVAIGAVLAGSLIAQQGSAYAGSDHGSDYYSGDVNGIALPAGTFLAIEYLGFRDSDTFVTTKNNFLSKTLFPGEKNIDSDFKLFTSITRFAYFTEIWGHPLVFEAAGTFAKVDEARIGTDHLTSADGFLDPVLFVDFGLINAPKDERFLVFTNYFYLPWGRSYDKFANVNVSTPNQFTWVPEISYAEGLGKFGLKNVWFDMAINASVHTDGDSPLAVPGAQFDNLSQDNSYDIKAFLRYVLAPATHIAVGIEKSWGGDQIASGGILGANFGPTSLGKDDYLKGHLQIAFPLTADFHVDTDFTHDFEREGGFKEDFTAEVRLTKLFLPTAPLPLK